MNFKTQQIGDVTHVRISTNAIDAGNIMEFKSAITPIINSSKKLIFNMNEVKFMDSSGFGALLSCLRVINGAGGKLKICGIAKNLSKLFDLMGINRIIEVYDSPKAAAESFQSGIEP